MYNVVMSKECWKKLMSQYQGEGDQRIIYLLERLLMSPLIDTEPMQSQVNTLILMVQQLAMARLPIDDKLLTYLLILHLPKSYSMLKTILSNSDSTKATSKGMAFQILLEECRCIQSSGGNAIAFYTKARNGGMPGKDKNAKKCSHCKKKGHEKSECQKLHKEEEEATKASNSNASTSSGSTSTASANVTVASVPKDDIIRLFRAVATPATPCGDHPSLSQSNATTVPLPLVEHLLKTLEELEPLDPTEEWIINPTAPRP
jgi:hypothetical protein